MPRLHRAMGRMPQWRATVAFTRRLKSSAGSTGLEPRACSGWVVRGGAQNFSPHNRLPQLRAGEGGRAGINALNPISAFPDRSTSQRHLIPHLMPHRRQLEASWWLCWSDSGHRSLGYRYIGGLSLLILFVAFRFSSFRLEYIALVHPRGMLFGGLSHLVIRRARWLPCRH